MFENIDIYTDRLELEKLGLSDEEIEGYFELFVFNFKRSEDELRFNIQ